MRVKTLLPLALSITFVAVILYLVPLREILSTVSSISITTFLYAFLLYTLSQIVRSLRWFLLIPSLSFSLSFLINSANILLNNVVPARAGELSWFYYTKRHNIDLKESLWVFLVARAYDLLGLFSLFLIAYAYIKYGVLTSLITLILVLLFSLALPLLIRLIPSRWKLKDIKGFLMRRHTYRTSILLILTALLTFLFKFTALYLLVAQMQELDLISSLLAFAGGDLTTILPIHSFMGYGTYEAGFLLPLKLLGLHIKEALKLGFITHNFLILSSLLLGLPSLFLLHTRR